MLGHSTPRRFALLLALTSSFFAAQAAEVSSAERVETTPGLSPAGTVVEGQRDAFHLRAVDLLGGGLGERGCRGEGDGNCSNGQK